MLRERHTVLESLVQRALPDMIAADDSAQIGLDDLQLFVDDQAAGEVPHALLIQSTLQVPKGLSVLPDLVSRVVVATTCLAEAVEAADLASGVLAVRSG